LTKYGGAFNRAGDASLGEIAAPIAPAASSIDLKFPASPVDESTKD
jgi:hypothetical protein